MERVRERAKQFKEVRSFFELFSFAEVEISTNGGVELKCELASLTTFEGSQFGSVRLGFLCENQHF